MTKQLSYSELEQLLIKNIITFYCVPEVIILNNEVRCSIRNSWPDSWRWEDKSIAGYLTYTPKEQNDEPT